MSDPENKRVASDTNAMPQPDGFDSTEDPCAVIECAKATAKNAARQLAEHFPGLGRKAGHEIVRAFRSVLVPRRRPGKRPRADITAAHADWTSGMRGPQLYRKHIPNLDKFNWYRKKFEIRRLNEAIRTSRLLN